MFEGLTPAEILSLLEEQVIAARAALEAQGLPEDCLICSSLDDAQEAVATAAEMIAE